MIDLEEIKIDLLDAFQNGLDDPVSLVTLIEMYGDQLDKEGALEDKQQFLEILDEQLKERRDVTFKISWDMPKQLIRWISGKNIKHYEVLKNNKIFSLIMKCFMSNALYGNPRELLISSCEIVSKLSAEDETIQYLQVTKNDHEPTETEMINRANMNRYPGDFFVGLKLHLVYELIFNILKRIDTLYSSKYLKIVVTSFKDIINTNKYTMEDPSIILRRVYIFCKNYIPNDPPKQVELKDGTILEGVELQNIVDKEIEIQRNLLRYLCTFAIAEGLNGTTDRSEVQVYYKMSHQKVLPVLFYEQLLDIKFRFYDLALSFDVDLKEELINCINECKRIYKALPKIEDVPTLEAQRLISKGVIKLSLSYHIQRMFHDTNLSLYPQGIIVLSSLHYLVSKKHLYPDIPLNDAIYLFLRFVSLGIVSKIYSNNAVDGAIRYLIWICVNNNSCPDLRRQMSQLSPFILSAFLECFLIKVSLEKRAESKTIQFTLFTRLLVCAPESIAFQFITNVLSDFPYIEGKYLIIGILRHLFTTKFPKIKEVDDNELYYSDQTKEKELVDKLSSMQISNTEGKDVVVNNNDTKEKEDDTNMAINLTIQRMSELTNIIRDSIKKAKNVKKADHEYKIIIGYLEFLLMMKPLWDKNLIKSLEPDFKSIILEKNIESKLNSLMD